MADRTPSAACPYCGEPKDRHTYATPTTCILGGFPPVKVESAAANTESRLTMDVPILGWPKKCGNCGAPASEIDFDYADGFNCRKCGASDADE